MYPATLLKVFISCKHSLVEFLGSLIYTIISSASSNFFPVCVPLFLLCMWILLYLGHRYSELNFVFMDFLVISMKYPSSLLIDFTLKSVLFDIRIDIPACFLVSFDWKIFSQPFTLR